MQIDFPGRKPLESSVFVSAKYSAPTTPSGFPVTTVSVGMTTFLTNVKAIAAGSCHSHTAAILNDTTVKAWGSNFVGEIGDGTTTNRTTAVSVVELSNVTAIALGSNHSHALLSNGTIKGWGWNTYYGEVGDGTTTDRYTPVSVVGITNAIAIGVGWRHCGAVLSDGTLKTWGANFAGQLGIGTIDSYPHPTPVTVSGLTNVKAIAGGCGHTCALLNDGTIKTWGANWYGQLGDGTVTDRYTPVTVSGLTNVVAIACGYYHTLALLSDGTVMAWGWNEHGQLGDGTRIDKHVPVTVSGLTNVVAIAAGVNHSVALLSDGTVKTWGGNESGQLGDGTVTDRYTPVTVSGLTNVVAIGAGGSYTYALLNDGTMRAWGSNSYGQLGDGTTTDRYTPVAVLTRI